MPAHRQDPGSRPDDGRSAVEKIRTLAKPGQLPSFGVASCADTAARGRQLVRESQPLHIEDHGSEEGKDAGDQGLNRLHDARLLFGDLRKTLGATSNRQPVVTS